MREGRVTSVISRNDGHVPILLQFQNGNLQAAESDKLECKVFEDVNTHKSVVLAASNQLLYRGEVESSNESLINTLVAIRNKKTGKVRLIEVDKCKLKFCVTDKKTPDTTDDPNKSRKEKNIELNKAFGSKHAKRRIYINEKLNVNLEDAKDQLEQTVKNMEVEPPEFVTPSEVDALSDCFPPIHRDAITIDEVYLLQEIISVQDLKALEKEALKMLQTDRSEMPYTDLINGYIENLQNSDDSNKLECCGIFLYVDALIKTITAPYSDIKKKSFVVCPCSKFVNKNILEKFTMNIGLSRTRPQMMKDKAASYAIILLLLALGHVLEYDSLAKALKIKSQMMLNISRALGLSQAQVDEKNVFVLKLPLTRPHVRARMRKRQMK